MSAERPLAVGVLLELAKVPPPGIMSLPRLAKRLGVGASVLLRVLSQLGDAEIAGEQGPGWVKVTQTEDRWLLQLTPQGQQIAASLSEEMPPDDPA